MELENRFLVLKRADIEAALNERSKFLLRQIVQEVYAYREEHRKPVNTYVIINQDEPYFPDVLKLMEATQ